MALEQLQFLEQQISQLDQEMANLLSHHQDAVKRLAEVPGLGVDSAQQIIAEVGPTAVTFPSAKQRSSWVGVCSGDDESAGVNYSHRSPTAQRSPHDRSKSALPECSGNSEISATGLNYPILNTPVQH